MKPTLPLSVAMILALAACQREPASAPEQAAAPSPSAPASPPAIAPVPEESAGMARFDGYGDLKLGSSADEARQAWGGELNTSTPAEPGGCYQLTPKWATDKADVAFMIEDGRFVRYDVNTAKEAAPGGGRVGMDENELRGLYGAGLQATPHKYVEGARYLSIAAAAGAPQKLLFETGADGKVTTWRIGLPPQVDYVEACS